MTIRARLVVMLAMLGGCAFHPPTYSWHRPGASVAFSESDRAALKADEDACTQERNSSSVRMFSGAVWYETTQRTLFKDCMEARGWTKE